MKNKISIVILAIICIACAKPEINTEPEVIVPDGAISGQFEQIETKAGFASNFSFYWSKDDALKVLTSSGTSEFVLASGQGKSMGLFVGSIPEEASLGSVLAYPYANVKSLTASSVEFNLPTQYTYSQSFKFGEGTTPEVVMPCYADIEDQVFTLKHLGGYLIYEISNIPANASKFVIKTTNGKRLNGIFSADLTANQPLLTNENTSNASEQTVVVNFTAGASTTQCFIIPVPQGAYGFVWDMYTSSDDKVGHGRQDEIFISRGSIIGFRERCAALGKDVSPVVIQVTTAEPKEVSINSALCGGNITQENGIIIERGVCYSVNEIPTINDLKVADLSTSSGAFECELKGLWPETVYYVRAYVISESAVYYGNSLSFKTLPLNTIYIENGVNLGLSIAVLGDWNNDGTKTTLYWAPVNCGYEEKGPVNSDSDHRLGKLYQWGAGDSSLPYTYNGSPVVAREMYYDTATPSPWYDYNTIDGTTSDKWNNNQGPCPEGWRLPTPLEFEVLCAGKNGSKGWISAGTYAGQSNTYAGAEFFGANADKTAGKGVFFPAAGYRSRIDGSAKSRGSIGYYWSSFPSRYYSYGAYGLDFDSSSLDLQSTYYRANAQSVRCVSE